MIIYPRVFLLLFSLFFFFLLLLLDVGHCIRIYNNSFDAQPHKLHVVKKSQALKIEYSFNFPAPYPIWPPGTGFASGTINLGGLIATEVTTFNKVWSTYEGGPNGDGATFFEPSAIPEGFFILGYYAQPNNRALFGRVIVVKDHSDSVAPALKKPTDYALVWSSKNLNVKEDSNGYIWAPIPEDGYQAAGLVVTTTSNKPPLDKVMCVRSDLTALCEPDAWIWGREGGVDSNEFNIFESRPLRKGEKSSAVSIGTFTTRSGGGTTFDMPLLVCLKNLRRNYTYMPNSEQLKTLINSYAPKVYTHPHEIYQPSSVEWFFSNGALLFRRGDEQNPIEIDPKGAKLPQGGSNDYQFWIDLPKDKNNRDRVMLGDIGSATAYYHVKPMRGGTYTDIAMWLYYPFNGGSSAFIGPVSISLGKIGEHVSDWEHVTLRVSNFNGILRKVYFSQHAEGSWVHAPDLEYIEGTNRFNVYSSLHGHASYPIAGQSLSHIQDQYVGIKNDTGKGDKFLDCATNYEIISADYLGNVTEPPWLGYARQWGPQIAYNLAHEIKKLADSLPEKLKDKFIKFTQKFPAELLGEEGPNGPKMKGSWSGEETK